MRVPCLTKAILLADRVSIGICRCPLQVLDLPYATSAWIVNGSSKQQSALETTGAQHCTSLAQELQLKVDWTFIDVEVRGFNVGLLKLQGYKIS